MRKINDILQDLINHKVSIDKAESEIREIIDSYKNSNFIEMKVEEVSFDIEDNGFLRLKVPYQYRLISGIKKNDKICVIRGY